MTDPWLLDRFIQEIERWQLADDPPSDQLRAVYEWVYDLRRDPFAMAIPLSNA